MDILDHMKIAALNAGEFIMQCAHNHMLEVHEHKDDGSYSLHADVMTQQLIIEYLKKNITEKHTIIAEEFDNANTTSGDLQFIIDPIDGTYNYQRNLQKFAISIGASQNGKLIGGVVYIPETQELFWAWENQGAYLNETKIQFNTNYPKKLIAFDGKSHKLPQGFLDKLNSVYSWQKNQSDVISMVYTACSRYDACVLPFTYLWDFAASAVILKEAGATVIDEHNGFPSLKSATIIAGKPDTIEKIYNLLFNKNI